MNYSRRRDRLRALIKKAGGEALLVTHEINVGYLTGFSGDSSYLLIHANGETILSDSRYDTQLAEECPGLEVATRTSSKPMAALISELVGSHRFTSLLIEGDSLSKSQFDRFSEILPSTELLSTSGLVEQLRAIKDKDELAEIRRSIHLAQRAFDAIRATMTPGQSE